MSTEECRNYRGDLAALALGRLDDDDELTRTRAHVDGCAECRTALDELESVARALPLASLDHVDAETAPPADLGARIATTAKRERTAARRRRTRRIGAGIVATAAALALAIGAFAVLRTQDPQPALQPFSVAPAGSSPAFGLTRNDMGTSIVLKPRGLDPNNVYWLWLADSTGQRFAAGTFRGGAPNETITFQSALPLDQTVRVWCTQANNEVVLDSWVK